MAYIPNDAEWYLADLIVEIRVEKDPRCVVHINTILINANSPNDAYEKANMLGIEHASDPYLNSAGQRVSTRYVGLKDLAVIHDKLEHGAELFFVERTDLQAEDVSALVQPKDKLSVFSSAEPSVGPDYSSGQIAEDYKKAMKS